MIKIKLIIYKKYIYHTLLFALILGEKMKYFAYGSNIDPKRMTDRGIIFSSRVPAILRGYKLIFNKRSKADPHEGYANIIEKENEAVEGALYEISESALDILDKFEGAPNHYRRECIEATTKNGVKYWAITYIANSKYISNNVKPTIEYLSHILTGRDIFSESYYEKIEHHPVYEKD